MERALHGAAQAAGEQGAGLTGADAAHAAVAELAHTNYLVFDRVYRLLCHPRVRTQCAAWAEQPLPLALAGSAVAEMAHRVRAAAGGNGGLWLRGAELAAAAVAWAPRAEARLLHAVGLGMQVGLLIALVPNSLTALLLDQVLDTRMFRSYLRRHYRLCAWSERAMGLGQSSAPVG